MQHFTRSQSSADQTATIHFPFESTQILDSFVVLFLFFLHPSLSAPNFFPLLNATQRVDEQPDALGVLVASP